MGRMRGSTGRDTGMHTIVVRRRRASYPPYHPRKLRFSADVVRLEVKRLLACGYVHEANSLMAEYGLK